MIANDFWFVELIAIPSLVFSGPVRTSSIQDVEIHIEDWATYWKTWQKSFSRIHPPSANNYHMEMRYICGRTIRTVWTIALRVQLWKSAGKGKLGPPLALSRSDHKFNKTSLGILSLTKNVSKQSENYDFACSRRCPTFCRPSICLISSELLRWPDFNAETMSGNGFPRNKIALFEQFESTLSSDQRQFLMQNPDLVSPDVVGVLYQASLNRIVQSQFETNSNVANSVPKDQGKVTERKPRKVVNSWMAFRCESFRILIMTARTDRSQLTMHHSSKTYRRKPVHPCLLYYGNTMWITVCGSFWASLLAISEIIIARMAWHLINFCLWQLKSSQ